eukprot:7381895-Prymnesium_polylepis.2
MTARRAERPPNFLHLLLEQKLNPLRRRLQLLVAANCSRDALGAIGEHVIHVALCRGQQAPTVGNPPNRMRERRRIHVPSTSPQASSACKISGFTFAPSRPSISAAS